MVAGGSGAGAMAEIGRLFSATQVVDDPGDLLEVARACGDAPLFYWEHPARRHAMLALGIVREIRASGPERFATVSAAARRILAGVQTAGGDRRALRVVGGFGFSERASAGTLWQDFPPARFVLPRLTWHCEDGRWRLTRVWDDGDASACDALLARVHGSGPGYQPAVPLLEAPRLTADDASRWRSRVDSARRLIAQGEVEKVVLARRRRLHANRAVDPATILARARDARSACFSFWVRGPGGASLIASTPELLVRRSGAAVVANALAGSAPRSDDTTDDRRYGAELLVCPKNAREHAIVVAAVRAALASVADQVVAPVAPDLLVLPEAQHLSTLITGRLRGASSVLDVGGLLHPTPAVCGAPRDAARTLIEREEPDRGWYAGAVGWMDDTGDGELAVALRSALVVGERVTLWAGAGIVEGSDADAELAETEAKMGALVVPFLAQPLGAGPRRASSGTVTKVANGTGAAAGGGS